MKQLTEYLKKFSRITPKSSIVTDALRSVLADMSISANGICAEYREGVVYVKGNATIRNEVLIKEKVVKEKLINKLQGSNIVVSKIS